MSQQEIIEQIRYHNEQAAILLSQLSEKKKKEKPHVQAAVDKLRKNMFKPKQ